MKKLIALLVVVSASAFAGSGTSSIVSNSAACISALAGSGPAYGITEWSTGVVTSAGIIMAMSGKPALCVVGGTNGVTAFAIKDVDVTSGAATWRECLAERKGLVISNDSTNKVYVSPAPIATGNGIPIAAGGRLELYGSEAQMGRMYAVSAAGTSSVSVVEW